MSTTQEYIDQHNLTKKVELVINELCRAKAEEPCSYLVSS